MKVLTGPPARGQIEPRIANDPRLSRSQIAAIKRLAEADPTATLDGLDAKMRPVVTAMVGGARRKVKTALMRNGDPAQPERPLAENWAA